MLQAGWLMVSVAGWMADWLGMTVLWLVGWEAPCEGALWLTG